MRRKRISAHALAIELCRRENMSYKKVHEHACELLERYAKGQSDPLRWNKYRKRTFGSIQRMHQILNSVDSTALSTSEMIRQCSVLELLAKVITLLSTTQTRTERDI